MRANHTPARARAIALAKARPFGESRPMPRPRPLAPLLALTLPWPLACGDAGGNTTPGFESGPASTGGPGPSSFGDGSSSSGGAPTTTDATTTDATTTAPTTGPDATTEPATGSTAPTTDGTGETGSSSTGDTTDATTANEFCGDGNLGGDELCDDGNRSDDDACLGDCTAGTAVLTLVGVGTSPAIAALFTPGVGWTSESAPIGVAEADLAATPDGALAVVRRASAVPAEQNELFYARWSDADPALFGAFEQVGAFGFAKDGPALASAADTATLAFLGTDNKHYTALYSGDAWAAFVPLPAGMVNVQAFGPAAAGLAPGLMSDTYAFYTGDDARIYYSAKASPGGAWAASQATPPASVLGTPVGVVDDQADLVLAYVRKTDGKLAVIKLITPQNAWSKEIVVHTDAITGAEIGFVRTDVGGYALAWKGFDNQGVYLATAAAFDAWNPPLTVEVPQATSTPPTLVPGVYGAEVEVLYTIGGKLRHARIADGALIDPVDVPGVAGATSVAATRVRLTPG